MASDTSVSDRVRSGPQFYFHFEFGVSYAPKHHAKKRGITYTSRNWLPVPSTRRLSDRRERRRSDDDARPRQSLLPPPPNTAESQGQRQTQTHSLPHPAQLEPLSQPFSQPLPRPPSFHSRQMPESLQPGRPSQTDAYATPSSPIERGRSAPPPSHDSPWDAEPEPMGCSALPRQPRPNEVWPWPRRRRGGPGPEGGASSSAPYHHHDDDDDGDDQNAAAGEEGQRQRDDDPERRQELEDLSTAMMTVDNGFENQWWYQGQREVLERRSLDAVMPSATSVTRNEWSTRMNEWSPALPVRQPTTRSIGWAIARDPDSALAGSPGDSEAVISPLSEFSSPRRAAGRLQRGNTLPDELFLP